MLARFYKDRRRAQAGTTLIELLVSVAILGLALVLIVGTLSTGLLDATLAKRNTAAEAVTQYELEKIKGIAFSSGPYSECFATESASDPQAASYSGSCPGGPFTLRADVTVNNVTSTRQMWTVTVLSWPDLGQVGAAVSVYKVNR